MIARNGSTSGAFRRSGTALVGPLREFLESLEPLMLSLFVVATVAVAVGGWWVVSWFRRPPGVRFQRLLGEYDHVAVVMHPNPDPDAMSCAMGVARIAETVDTEATLQYAGEIRHQENRAFRTVLDLDLEAIESSSQLAADAVVLVDHNTPRGFAGSQTVEPIAVVDHHPGNGAGTEFTDVRTEYGAASTIVVEYLDELGASMNGGDGLEVSPELATGLLYGIQSDTKHLTNGCSRAEFDACAALFDAIDEDLLDRVANPQVSDDVLQVKATAITEKRVEGPFAVCGVGEISNVDAIPQAADELMQLEGVTAVVVYGEYDGTIHLSGRSRDDRVHMGETLRHAISDIPMANAGGHARMGGGQVSVDHIDGIGPSDGISRNEFEERLFSAMSGER
ncbi:bifunctional oligoribonuclease/PAP phosphatase NrnA [Haloterrigena sp. SYSU A558-1]|uniref:Bifunctional oligoribonuclease/PAP phosphatase NrnA n=1 Tax=Haloterrigena gelatinilytica TaxID=2741724 RepID=A0A8J8KHV0_9EURY|nr:bifunctional oligoribonuclease/PAP phosphatase NrnA [Haloterrigena gelatinilytica]NUB91589.1 bifunctional oligoribonuclease/PAP phosphatase NrnA [Haloterrigena gelatinilytica]NUC72674.1 bifunctional oligoribonuclease/PAP phosphatase NrnA [Haloterrigena gelatinilytica]